MPKRRPAPIDDDALPAVSVPPSGRSAPLPSLERVQQELATAREDLATMFDYPPGIRRLIYTTNNVESYNGQLRKVTKTKGAFPSAEAVRKLLFLVTRNITRQWTMPVQNWASILNQLAIRFADRFPI